MFVSRLVSPLIRQTVQHNEALHGVAWQSQTAGYTHIHMHVDILYTYIYMHIFRILMYKHR